MERRNLMISVGSGVSLFGLTGILAYNDIFGHDKRKQTVGNPPKEAEVLMPLASHTKSNLDGVLDDARVFIRGKDTIVVYYRSDANSEDRLMTEFSQITRKFVESVNSTDIEPDNIPSLSMVASNVHAIVPKSSIKSSIQGNISEDALLETIEIVGTIDINNSGDGHNHNHE